MNSTTLEASQTHPIEHIGDETSTLGRISLGETQTESDVLGYIEMRKERVILEHRCNRTFFGRPVPHIVVIDRDRAGVWSLEPGDHAQRRGLATTRWTEQREELPARNIETHLADDSPTIERFLETSQFQMSGRHTNLKASAQA